MDMVTRFFNYDNYKIAQEAKVTLHKNNHDYKVATTTVVTTPAEFAKGNTQLETKNDRNRLVINDWLNGYAWKTAKTLREKEYPTGPLEVIQQSMFGNLNAFGIAQRFDMKVRYNGQFLPFSTGRIDPNYDFIGNLQAKFDISHYSLEDPNKVAWTENTYTSLGGASNWREAFLTNINNARALQETYFIHGDDRKTEYKVIPANTHSSVLALPNNATDISSNDYLSFFVRASDQNVYDGIEFTVTDQSGMTVTFKSTIDNQGAYFQNIQNIRNTRVLPFVFPSYFHTISYPNSKAPTKMTAVSVDFQSLNGQNVYVVPVQWLKDIGLDTARITETKISNPAATTAQVEVSSVNVLGQNAVRTSARDLKEFTDELERTISNARINQDSSGTVEVIKGFDISTNERKSTGYRFLEDGRILMARFDRPEDHDIWTPITAINDFNYAFGQAAPTMNVFAGYPGYTVADNTAVTYDGVSKTYYCPTVWRLHLSRFSNQAVSVTILR